MEQSIDAIVKRVVARVLAERAAPPSSPAPAATAPMPPAPKAPAPAPAAQPAASRPLLDASAVDAAAPGSTLEHPADALVTPLARDRARERNVTLRPAASAPTALTLALGCDHGGFRLKESLKRWLESQGHRVRDLGTASEAACDYPDFALAVARAVAGGTARFGIVIDGAGIGSAMVANKVAGVLAANCPHPDAARNAREHNYANVLTLGARFLDDAAAQAVVSAFLTTPEGEARHLRRVEKIRALDRTRSL